MEPRQIRRWRKDEESIHTLQTGHGSKILPRDGGRLIKNKIGKYIDGAPGNQSEFEDELNVIIYDDRLGFYAWSDGNVRK